jgi:hypothetical protein
VAGQQRRQVGAARLPGDRCQEAWRTAVASSHKKTLMAWRGKTAPYLLSGHCWFSRRRVPVATTRHDGCPSVACVAATRRDVVRDVVAGTARVKVVKKEYRNKR